MTLNRILWTTVLVGATLAMPLSASLNYNEEYHVLETPGLFKKKKVEKDTASVKSDYEKIASESHLLGRGMFNVYKQDSKYFLKFLLHCWNGICWLSISYREFRWN